MKVRCGTIVSNPTPAFPPLGKDTAGKVHILLEIYKQGKNFWFVACLLAKSSHTFAPLGHPTLKKLPHPLLLG